MKKSEIKIDLEDINALLENPSKDDIEFIIDELHETLDYIMEDQGEKRVAQGFDTFCHELAERQRRIEEAQGEEY